MTDIDLALQLATYRVGAHDGPPVHPRICDLAAERIVALRADLLQSYLENQRAWSRLTFGPGDRAEGICKHIEKELAEIRREPGDLVEWIDVIILALDGYWRAGGDPAHIMNLLRMKQAENFAREWPAPGTVPEGEPTEHLRIHKLEPMEMNPDAVTVREAPPCAPDQHDFGETLGGVCLRCGRTWRDLEA